MTTKNTFKGAFTTKVTTKNRFTEICCHRISYYYQKDIEMPECEEEHVKECICEGYNQGELNYCNSKTENRGWWSIDRS